MQKLLLLIGLLAATHNVDVAAAVRARGALRLRLAGMSLPPPPPLPPAPVASRVAGGLSCASGYIGGHRHLVAAERAAHNSPP